MKKMFVVFGFMMTLPVWADPTIGYNNNSYTYNNATTTGDNMCVVDVLETYTGPANLTAQWGPNEIQLRWYNNNTQIIPAVASQTCDYAGGLTIPATAPSRVGYNFAGWHVRELMSFSSLSLSTGSAAYGKGTSSLTSDTSICYWYNPSISNDWQGGNNATCKTNSKFTELENHEWKTEFSNGTLYGMAHCSKKPGNHSSYTWPQTSDTTIAQWQTTTVNELDTYSGTGVASEAKYCWCKATGWKASNQSTVKGSSSPLAWVFRSDAAGSASDCANDCARLCAFTAQNYSAFRAALFTPTNANNAD